MKILFTISLITFQFFGFAQTKIFQWQVGHCNYKGEYDSSKQTISQLQETYLLWYGLIPNYYQQPTENVLWEPELMDIFDLDSLEIKYTSKLKWLNELSLVKSSFWEEVRQKKIDRLNKFYELKRTMLRAYNDPNILKEHTFSDSSLTFVNLLIKGGSTMLKKWRNISLNICKQNGDSRSCLKEFELKYNASQKLKYARDFFMSCWWECVIRTNNCPHYQQESQKEFKKLFDKVSVDCEI